MQDPRTAMAEATRAFQIGNFKQAQAIAAEVAHRLPGNVQVLQFLGVAQSQAGDPASGLATLRRALSLAPNDAQLRFNVANAALSAGQPASALDLAANLPSEPPVIHLRALAAKEAGETEKAAAHFAALVRVAPADPMALNNYGNFLSETGQSSEAVTILRRAAEADPASAQIRLNLGRALTVAEDFDGAMEQFREAVRLAPDDPEILFELGKSLVRYGQQAEALPLLGEAGRKGLRSAELFTLIGISQTSAQNREAAEQAYRLALSIDPDHTRALLNLGIMLEHDNRLAELKTLVAEADGAGDKAPELDYLRALLLRREDRIEDALQIAQGIEPDMVDEALIAEFIGKLADRLGKHETAFASFERMNRAMSLLPAARQFDGAERAGRIEQRTDRITPQWYARFGETPPNAGPTPAFLGGFLRSGTTLLDTILMGHPHTEVREEEEMLFALEGAGGAIEDLPELSGAAVEEMRRAYFAEVNRTAPHDSGTLLIDKYPLMTLRAAYIHRAFPEAKFVFALRHPCDVVLSCFMQNFKVTEAMASFLDIQNAARMYAAAMAHWKRCREVMPLDVHTIRYEDMVVDLEGELRPLIAFLGLEWDDALLDHQRTARERGHIRTPSYAQVTESVYTRASGRWEAYRDQMAPALPILQPWIEEFGYA